MLTRREKALMGMAGLLSAVFVGLAAYIPLNREIRNKEAVINTLKQVDTSYGKTHCLVTRQGQPAQLTNEFLGGVMREMLSNKAPIVFSDDQPNCVTYFVQQNRFLQR